MKVLIATHKAEEVDLNLPLFFKRPSSGGYFAILSETSSVCVRSREVTHYEYHEPVSQHLQDSESVEITAEEFTRIFDERIEQLQSLKSQFFKQTT